MMRPEDAERVLSEHEPSMWRSFTNENTILRCCTQDFGNATRKAKRGDEQAAWAAWRAHVAQALAAASEPQDVQTAQADALRYFPICEPCVRGEGSECHTPECALFLRDVPPDGVVEAFAQHDCATCRDCLHDGNKCCGCYDGACCQDRADRLAQGQPTPAEPRDTGLRARIEALVERWRYTGEFGWGPWQAGEGPDHEGQVLDECASALRAALADPAVDDDSERGEA